MNVPGHKHLVARDEIGSRAQLRRSIDEQRNRLFVGRERELATLHKWLEQPETPTTVVSVRGMGGVGKSTLVRQFLGQCTAQGVSTLLVDGRVCPPTPRGFTDYVQGLAGHHPADGAHTYPPQWEPLFEAVARGGRVVFAIDDFERLVTLEPWLRDVWLPQLPSLGLLVILAGRTTLSASWLSDPAWQGQVIDLTLEPFTRREGVALLERLGVTANQEQLLRDSGGLPLALALTHASPDTASHHPGRVRGKRVPVALTIAAHLRRELDKPRTDGLLEALTVLLEADADLLSRTAGHAVPVDDYYKLAHASFVQVSDFGLSLHDAARAHFLADLRQRSPSQFRQLQIRAATALKGRLEAETDPIERRRFAAGLLALCSWAMPQYKDQIELDARPDGTWMTPPQPGERDILQAMLSGWIGPGFPDDSGDLLDALLDNAPDSIRVLRSADGQPLAFHALVLLHEQTIALLEQFKSGALYLQHCSDAERRRHDVPPADADTFWRMLAGYGNACGYTESELSGIMLQDVLSMVGSGLRGMTFSNDPGLIAYLAQLGATPRPGFVVQTTPDAEPFQLLELDFRHTDFGAWCLGFLQLMYRGDDGAKRSAPPADTLPSMLQEALSNLTYPSRMEQSELAVVFGLSGREVKRRLERYLTAPEPPPPLTAALQQLLAVTYLERFHPPDVAAALLHMSRSTYYRKRAQALAALSEVIHSSGEL